MWCDFGSRREVDIFVLQLEIYGPGKFHPSDAPRRDGVTAVVFHMNDVEDIDASYGSLFQSS